MSPVSLFWIVLVIPTMSIGSIARAAESDTQRVARQFREYCLHESTDRGERLLDDVELPKTSVDQATKLLASLRDDGSWADIEYKGEARASWQPYNHLTRVLSLTVHARRNGTPPEQSAQCIEGVHRALTFWMPNDFQCPNWWYNEIGVPKILGNIGLLLGDDLKSQERQYITATVMARSKVGAMTGQNRVWLAGIGVMRAALLDDESLLRTASNVIQEEIRVTTGEGIQPDWSFHQHGPQQQFGNYGMAFAVELARWATVLRDTPVAIPDQKLAIIRNYLLEGQNWVTWRGAMDISSCGRQLSPNSPRSKAGVVRGVMRTMTVVDPEHADDYIKFVSRNAGDGAPNDLIGNRYFWRSDYAIHRRPELCVTVKMSSKRVIGGETVNNENLSGLLGADGAMYIYRSGHEYDDIFPVWDWRRLPGVTSVVNDAPLDWSKAPDRKQQPDFVGGASDSENAVVAMDFHRGALRAKKAWFFCGDVVVCLGTDIELDGGDKPVVTTINQCLLNGPVKLQQGGKQFDFSGPSRQFDDVDWVEHDGIRYVLAERSAINISAAPQTGNWRKVFDTPSTPKADVTKDVLNVAIQHGPKTYAYYILPADRADQISVKVLSHTSTLQAVKVGDSWLGAAFWKAGSEEVGGVSIDVDQPCVMAITSVPDGYRVTLADPTQRLTTIKLNIDGMSQTVDLPQGGDAGKSVSMHFGTTRR